MDKIYNALGFMSGTSGDGVDASIIKSDGKDKINIEYNNYEPYPQNLTDEIHSIKEKLNNSSDLDKYSSKIDILEKKLTDFHSQMAIKLIKGHKIDIIGFHGQTIFHNSNERLSRQIGLGKNLSKVTKRKVVYNFRQNDLKNGGEGAPLAPIYHQVLFKNIFKKKKIKLPLTILNLGGIANITIINEKFEFESRDIGPGNCMIDKWFRLNSEKNFDDNGNISRTGKIDKFILDQSLENYYNYDASKKKSLDINDFDISFCRGLSLKNGGATLTEFTTEILSNKLLDNDIYVCGGGRKNKYLMESLQKKISNNLILIDHLEVDGDFIESQAFAFLAIRSNLGLPISFPSTTGCKKPLTGGMIIESY